MVKRFLLALTLILTVGGIIGPGPVDPPVEATTPHHPAIACVGIGG